MHKICISCKAADAAVHFERSSILILAILDAQGCSCSGNYRFEFLAGKPVCTYKAPRNWRVLRPLIICGSILLLCILVLAQYVAIRVYRRIQYVNIMGPDKSAPPSACSMLLEQLLACSSLILIATLGALLAV